MSEENPKAKETPPIDDAGKIFINEVTQKPARGRSRWRGLLQAMIIPGLAIFSGLVVGGIVIILTTPAFYAALRVSILDAIKVAFETIKLTYGALFAGAFGNIREIIAAIVSGDPAAIRQSFYALL